MIKPPLIFSLSGPERACHGRWRAASATNREWFDETPSLL
jgi:hypothetical protein